MKTRTEAEMKAYTEHKRLADTARYFAMSMFEGPLAQTKMSAEIVDCAFAMAWRFLERSDKEWQLIKYRHCPTSVPPRPGGPSTIWCQGDVDESAEGKAEPSTSTGAADPVPPGAFKTADDKKLWVGSGAITGDLTGSEPPRVPKLDALRGYSTENGARLRDLAQRLIASGPKAAHVSASETHEISDGLINLLDLIEGVNRG